MRDLIHAGRALMRTPVFALVASLVLSVGIGLNLTVFQLGSAMFLRPLLVEDPNSLVRFDRVSPRFRSNETPYSLVPLIAAQRSVLSELMTHKQTSLVWGDGYRSQSVAFVSSNWFAGLGLPALRGRTLQPGLDDLSGAAPAVVISDYLWRQDFDSSPSVIGSTALLNGHSATIVGIVPSGVEGVSPSQPHVWIPIEQISYFLPGTDWMARWDTGPELYARLNVGVSLSAAREALRSVMSSIAEQYPGRLRAGQWLEPLSARTRFRDPALSRGDQTSWREKKPPANRFAAADLETRLAFGELPGVAAAPEGDRHELLSAYAIVHLEEEIRREAMVKDWGAFLRFLRLAAAESGQILNYAAISQETGLSQPTIKSHYQLLEDMFIGFSVGAWSGSSRKHLLSTPRFLLFDLGLRHAAADLTPSRDVVRANPGPLFEQWVGIELWKRLRYLRTGSLHYLRTKDGAEVDFIVAHGGTHTPIEVKWTERPSAADARHLLTFLREHPKTAKHGYLICRCRLPMQLHDKVTALPWSCL